MIKLKPFIVLFVISLCSCTNSKVEECIDTKVEMGMNYSDAKDECEEGYNDSKIR